jgi:hypothetical protein
MLSATTLVITGALPVVCRSRDTGNLHARGIRIDYPAVQALYLTSVAHRIERDIGCPTDGVLLNH